MMSSSLTNDIDHRQSPPVLTVDVPTRHLVRSVDTNTSSSTPPPPNNYYNTVNGTSNNMIVEPPIVLPYVGGGGQPQQQQQQQHHHYMTYTNSNTGGAAAANAAFVTTAIPSSSHNNPADHRTQYSNSTRSTGSGGGVNNTMLQLAFPTAEYALQQQQMLEQQQQYAIQYEQQQQQQKQWQQQYIQQQSQQQQVPIVPPLPLQQAQPPMLHNPESFPWTLGSTDGAYAMSLLLQQQQEQSIQQQQPVGAVSSGVMEVALVNELNAKLYLQQQQQQLLLMQQQQQGGVAPPVTTGATIAALTGEAADNGDDDNNPMSPLHDENDGGGGDLVAALGMNSRQQQQQQDLLRKPMLGPEGLQVRTSEYYSDVKSNSLLLSSQNTVEEAMELLQSKKSLYQVRLFRQPSSAVEACLAAACEVMNFDIAEMWLRTGPKTHQLTNSHLRPTALEDSVRKDLVDVYYGETSSERTHRLSPALCKRAKEAADVVWVTAHNPASAEALRCSISNVRTAVAVPVCHQASNTNMTILFFSIRRYVLLLFVFCFWSLIFYFFA